VILATIHVYTLPNYLICIAPLSRSTMTSQWQQRAWTFSLQQAINEAGLLL